MTPDDGIDAQNVQAPAGLLDGVMDRLTEILGMAASEATIHYAAAQEGQRICAPCSPRQLPEALKRMDAILQQESRIIEDTGQSIRIGIRGSELLQSGKAVQAAIVQGMLQGALEQMRGKPFDVEAQASSQKGEHILQFRAKVQPALGLHG